MNPHDIKKISRCTCVLILLIGFGMGNIGSTANTLANAKHIFWFMKIVCIVQSALLAILCSIELSRLVRGIFKKSWLDKAIVVCGYSMFIHALFSALSLVVH